jgi:anthraniloyl-CoA monooxygenase
MRLSIIGGGPGGLYFAILMKKAWPHFAITVYERNRADDTFGFGVVFSDETLGTFESFDRDSYRAITEHFAYWDDIEIHFKDTVHRIGGNGFCGCSRPTLLRLLQERANALGVVLKFETEVTDLDAVIAESDLVIGADGINSGVRQRFAQAFQPQVPRRLRVSSR